MTRLLTLAAGLLLCIGNANAANLLTNGSFESGLTGWSVGGTQGQGYLPSVVVTNGVSGCCFGEAVAADSVVGGSPDAAGTHGVYFVDDLANQTLTQSVFLAAGNYEIGFDAYAPLNGFNNVGDAFFNAVIAGINLANYTVHTQNLPQQWVHFSGIANVLTAGLYDVSFNYVTSMVPAADVVIDRVYIAASDADNGTPVGVPEPASLALIGAALAALGCARRKSAR